MLRRLWNNIIIIQDFNLVKNFIKIMVSYQANSTDLSKPNVVRDVIASIKSRTLAGEILDDLAEAICWNTSNLVEGSITSIRTDDPGDRLDKFSNVSIFKKLSNNDRKKIQAYELVYNEILNLGQYEDINDIVDLDEARKRNLKKTIEDIIKMISRLSVAPISNCDIWIETNNRWKKNI